MTLINFKKSDLKLDYSHVETYWTNIPFLSLQKLPTVLMPWTNSAKNPVLAVYWSFLGLAKLSKRQGWGEYTKPEYEYEYFT